MSIFQRAQVAYDKLNSDMNDRISEAVRIFKAARIFNYRFVALNPVEAIRGELEMLAVFPSIKY